MSEKDNPAFSSITGRIEELERVDEHGVEVGGYIKLTQFIGTKGYRDYTHHRADSYLLHFTIYI